MVQVKSIGVDRAQEESVTLLHKLAADKVVKFTRAILNSINAALDCIGSLSMALARFDRLDILID